MRRLKRGCKKLNTLVINYSEWRYEFRKLLRGSPDLRNELSSHNNVNNSPINIRDAL